MRTEGYDRYGKSFRRDGRPLLAEDERPYGGWQRDRQSKDRQYSERQQRPQAEESEAYRELKAQLTEYYRKGVKVSLGGVRMPVSKIARICAVREEGKYMGDYIIDEAGELTEVRFDRVSR